MKKEKSYQIDMCEGAILPKMLSFTIPLIGSSVLQLFFNAADIIVVGHFAGDNSLAAVGSTGSLINLLTNLFVGLSIGTNVLAAKEFGSKDEKSLTTTVHTSILLSILSGLVLTVVGFVFAQKILVLMQSPEEVLPLAASYLRIYFLGMTAMMIYNFGSAILRAVGDTKRPFFFLVIAGIINVVLNLIFVIQFKMDVNGVAIATVISQCVSAVCVIVCLIKEKGMIRLVPKKLKISKAKLAQILKIGLPAGFQGILFSFSNVIIQSSINSFGAIIVAGNSASINIEGFVYVAMNAFSQGAISFCSQNYGAKRFDRIKKITIESLCCVFVTGLVLGLCATFFSRQLLGIYSPSSQVIDAGSIRMKFICGTYFLCGMMDVMVGCLRGIGYSITPMIVSLLGACGLRIVWILTVFQIENFHTIQTIYLSYPISWVVTFFVHLICFAFLFKKIKK